MLCCAILVVLVSLSSLPLTQVRAAYVIGIWPGSSCQESSSHVSMVSNQNEGCYLSGMNAYNLYSRFKLFVVTCYGDSASSTWRIQGMRQYCNVYSLDFTGRGNGCVRWGGYDPLEASVRISCDNKGWEGFPCTNNGGNAFCSTGICRSRCCNAGTDVNCATCSETGQCTACASGYVLSGSACVKPIGAACTTNQQCQSNVCAQTCCQSPFTSGCLACNGNGVCTTCPAGTTLVLGRGCMTQDGGACYGNYDCLSGKCYGRTCCSTGVDPMCVSCNGFGQCSECYSSYILNGTKCQFFPRNLGPSATSSANGGNIAVFSLLTVLLVVTLVLL